MVSSVSSHTSYTSYSVTVQKTETSVQDTAAPRRSERVDALNQKLFGTLDSDGDGGISKGELGDFLTYTRTGSLSGAQSARAPNAAKAAEAAGTDDFSMLARAFDSNSDGTVTTTELADGLRTLFEGLTEQLAGGPSATDMSQDDIFNAIDAKGDGAIDQDELGEFLSANADRPGESGDEFLTKLEKMVDAYREAAQPADTATETTKSTAA